MQLSQMPLALLGISFSLICACKVPRDAVVLASTDIMSGNQKLSAIPSYWAGRLLRIGAIPDTGGEAAHRHGIFHVHNEISSPSDANITPLGLTYPVSADAHQHVVASYAQTPYYSDLAPYNPVHQDLNAYIVRRTLYKVPVGLIVLYLGNTVPKGWLLCDGNNNTPDLREKYIELTGNGRSPNPSGNNIHQHRVTHSHKWSVDSPDIRNNRYKALAGDAIHYPTDAYLPGPFNHIHGVQETPMAETLTDPTPVFPPSLNIGFIQATAQARRIPANAILPIYYISDVSIPWGWRRWDKEGKYTGAFVFGAPTHAQVLQTFGNATHHHTFSHQHTITLTPFSRDSLAVSQGGAPPISLAEHSHTIQARQTVVTDNSASLPKYVSFPFIQKK
jgi:hypothetical protein